MKAIKLLAILLTAFLVISCSSDSDDNNQSVPQNLLGTWGGDNTTSTGNARTLIVTFNADFTGDLSYESNSYIRMAYFTYLVTGNLISCTGVMAGEDGNVNENWSMSFEYHDNYLKPVDAYDDITLYKAGYDSNNDNNMGSEDKKNESMLENTTWSSSDANGGEVTFYRGGFMSFQNVSKYGYYCNGEWYVSESKLWMWPTVSDVGTKVQINIYWPTGSYIVKLSDTEMQLKDAAGNMHSYTRN